MDDVVNLLQTSKEVGAKSVQFWSSSGENSWSFNANNPYFAKIKHIILHQNIPSTFETSFYVEDIVVTGDLSFNNHPPLAYCLGVATTLLHPLVYNISHMGYYANTITLGAGCDKRDSLARGNIVEGQTYDVMYWQSCLHQGQKFVDGTGGNSAEKSIVVASNLRGVGNKVNNHQKSEDKAKSEVSHEQMKEEPETYESQLAKVKRKVEAENLVAR